ncbi:GDA1/CD39 (nucleoside phosphatase) family protein [Besnoitia besnoiti]|nr:GDA1/CD39 (nucleoside phosphatase) family protein [Besnoitia besnoiti]PFH31304.1 GDA1/CD39 (nucleoside phosphatase) family protein [Besnoitia besnoiti]
MLCRENRIDPSQPLEQRLQFEGCKRIKGTGDFDRCYALVERFIVGPKYPLPANIEAASSGFESLKQVFQFASTSAAMVITGGAMVGSIRVLKRANLLGSSFSGDPHELEKAARIFCGASVKVEDGKGAAIHLPNHHEKLGVWTYDICKVIAMNVALVKHMMAAEKRPASISWEKSVKNDEGVEVADLGWHVGAILQQILDVEKFGRMAYESGWTYNL